MKNRGTYLDRWAYTLKIEGRCIVIAIGGIVIAVPAWIALMILGHVLQTYWAIIAAQLWVGCWFCGTQIWKAWYIKHTGE